MLAKVEHQVLYTQSLSVRVLRPRVRSREIRLLSFLTFLPGRHLCSFAVVREFDTIISEVERESPIIAVEDVYPLLMGTARACAQRVGLG